MNCSKVTYYGNIERLKTLLFSIDRTQKRPKTRKGLYSDSHTSPISRFRSCLLSSNNPAVFCSHPHSIVCELRFQ